jgi:hypothetical protein
MMPGPCLFVSCVPNVARPMSVCIMFTQCCQARVYFYLVYPSQHWVHKIQTDTGLATLGTQDTNRHWPGNIGYTRYKQTLAWKHWEHKMKRDTGLATLGTQDINKHGPRNIGYTRYKQTPVSIFILCTQCCQAINWFNLVYPFISSKHSLFMLVILLMGQCTF